MRYSCNGRCPHIGEFWTAVGSVAGVASAAVAIAALVRHKRSSAARLEPYFELLGKDPATTSDAKWPVDVLVGFKNIGDDDACEVIVHCTVTGRDGIEIDQETEPVRVVPDARPVRDGLDTS